MCTETAGYSMTAVGHKASSGVAMPAARWGVVTPDQLASEIHYLAVPALKCTERDVRRRVREAKRERSLQECGTASCNEVRPA